MEKKNTTASTPTISTTIAKIGTSGGSTLDNSGTIPLGQQVLGDLYKYSSPLPNTIREWKAGDTVGIGGQTITISGQTAKDINKIPQQEFLTKSSSEVVKYIYPPSSNDVSYQGFFDFLKGAEKSVIGGITEPIGQSIKDTGATSFFSGFSVATIGLIALGGYLLLKK